MLKGLALTPPVIGRIAIGKVVERNGKRLPEKDDEFTITSQIQNKDGWIAHPLNDALRQEGQKLRSLPIRLLFDDPDLNFRANYTAFDRQSGRPVCVGDGESCKRVTSAGMQALPCPTPVACPIGAAGHCKPYGRLHVGIRQDAIPEDGLGSFIFRTTGFNSIRTLATRLRYLQAVSGDRLASMDLELRLRGKSTTMSHRTPIYYVDITTSAGCTLDKAVMEAVHRRCEQLQAGIDQKLLDDAARSGYALGEFEESEEEAVDVVEEFFPEAGQDESSHDPCPGTLHRLEGASPTLAAKLQNKASGNKKIAASA